VKGNLRTATTANNQASPICGRGAQPRKPKEKP
jgi:hypothetical protein